MSERLTSIKDISKKTDQLFTLDPTKLPKLPYPYEDWEDPPIPEISETNRGFTGHEQLDSVGLIHMNGRVYDPLLGRFGTPDPMTENPFSTQGWNRYSYVGNSPVNFTDPSGYCFMGCFWQPVFRAIGNFLRQKPGSGPWPPACAGIIIAQFDRGADDVRLF